MNARLTALIVCAIFTAALAASLKWGDSMERLLGTSRLAHPLAEAVPVNHAGWKGREAPLSEKERRAILVDDSVRRDYTGPSGEEVTLFISFHGNKERGLQRYYHNPTVCYPAAGWTLAATRFERVTIEDAGQEIPTCRYVFDRDGSQMAVTTIFRVDHEFLDESPRNKPLWMLVERLKPDLGDEPGTFVQVQVIVPIRKGGEAAAAAASARFLQAFGRKIISAVSSGVGS